MRHALLVCALLVLPSCARRPPQATALGVPSDTDAPLSFELPRFPDGERVRLESHRGEVVILDVWATWCEPCLDALPAYEALARDYEDKDVAIYALSIDEDPAQIARFLEKTSLGLSILHDRDARVAERALRTQMVPSTFVIDRQGHIRHRHEGFNAGTVGRLRAELDALLKEAK